MKITCALFLCFSILLSGCSTTFVSQPQSSQVDAGDYPQKLAVFFDGTANHQLHRTNIARLFELTSNQNTPHTRTFYTEGVGSDGRLLGLAVGWGEGYDVRQAYQFLAQTYYSSDDSIYLFGFSRGSYSARILAGMIYVAGLVDLQGMSVKEQERLVKKLYSAYKGKKSLHKRKLETAQLLREWELTSRRDIKISVMGLWDTVSALGVPNYQENVGEVNKRYVDQVCNVEKVYHAVALDDNRARIYTPILMSSSHLTNLCPAKSLAVTVEEVWFSGSHADVGGGYKEGSLAANSLNWMLDNLSTSKLLPANACVFSDPYDIIHDAEADNAAYIALFKRQRRHPEDYLSASSYNQQRLKVHASVIDRLAHNKTKVAKAIENRRRLNPELKTYDSLWHKQALFNGCFDDTETGRSLNQERCINIEVIKDKGRCGEY